MDVPIGIAEVYHSGLAFVLIANLGKNCAQLTKGMRLATVEESPKVILAIPDHEVTEHGHVTPTNPQKALVDARPPATSPHLTTQASSYNGKTDREDAVTVERAFVSHLEDMMNVLRPFHAMWDDQLGHYKETFHRIEIKADTQLVFPNAIPRRTCPMSHIE